MLRSIMIVTSSAIAIGGPALAQENSARGTITRAQASSYFAELERACATNDPGGVLWAVEIYGPVMLVDATTRRVIANRPVAEGLLEERDGVYVGALPADQPLANAPIKWAGLRWAMVLTMFLPDTEAGRVTLLAHESFHRVQFGLGLMAFGRENNHLDTPEGRTLMKLEWNALQAALSAKDEARVTALRDALAFRAARRDRFPDATERESAVEIREGLAQYTGLRIAGANPAEAVANVANRRTREDGIVRSFGYNSGPLYGFLLDAADPSWREGLTRQSDLGSLLAQAFDIEPDPARADSRAASYGGPAIRIAEAERERGRQARLAAFRALLIDGPVLIVDLSVVTTGTIDTRAVHPLEEGKIVFTVRKLIAEWGTLTVDGGALLEDRTIGQGRLSLTNATPDHLSGSGWTLELNEGWALAPAPREGDIILRRDD